MRFASRSAVAWIVFGLFVAVGIACAMLPGTPADTFRATEEAQREAFSVMVSAEPSMRHQAETNFPGDPWSQDDDFHALEVQKVISHANLRGLSTADVLRALDDGLREGWPRPDNISMKATVPPCRPRAIY